MKVERNNLLSKTYIGGKFRILEGEEERLHNLEISFDDVKFHFSCESADRLPRSVFIATGGRRLRIGPCGKWLPGSRVAIAPLSGQLIGRKLPVVEVSTCHVSLKQLKELV